MKTNRDSSEQYQWGDRCQGWRLLNRKDLSIIQERMPPGAFEARHFHHNSRQFFFILSGSARIGMEGQQYLLSDQDGLEIPPGAPHQIFNNSNKDLEFLLVSHPSTLGDRVLSP